MKVTFNPYTPAEAEAATGRNVESQRNDRRAGYDPQPAGHARYDLVGMARLLVRQQFADSGIGPSRSMSFIDDAAAEVGRRASFMRPAWSERALAWGDSVASENQTDGRYPKQFFGKDAFDVLRKGVRRAFPFAPGKLLDLLAPSGISDPRPGQMVLGGIVVWPDGTHTTEEQWWKAPGELAVLDQRNLGVIKGFSIYHMARLLSANLPRPFFDILAEDE